MEFSTKPCPFCNSPCNILRKLEDGKPFWFIRCEQCGIQTQHFHEECPTESSWVNVHFAMHDAIQKAVDAWNNRPVFNYIDCVMDKASIQWLAERGIIDAQKGTTNDNMRNG